jgi:hypothetical protein
MAWAPWGRVAPWVTGVTRAPITSRGKWSVCSELHRRLKRLQPLNAVASIWVAIHEFSYAGSHPYAVGPANVIGVSGVAGALLSLAVILIATAIRRGEIR